jgi:hypothetical protein
MTQTPLNSGLTLAGQSLDVQRAFLPRTTRTVLLQKRIICRLAAEPHLKGRISPWWMSLTGIDAGDVGVRGEYVRSQNASEAKGLAALSQLMRARLAVCYDWTPQFKYFIAAWVRRPVYALYGRAASQPVHAKKPTNVVFIGGGYQLYIPNLTAEDVQFVKLSSQSAAGAKAI